MDDDATTEPGITIRLPAEAGDTPRSGETVMAQEIDATIRLAMDQSFASSHQALTQSGVRHNNDMNFVAATVQLQHELNRQLVGAKAAANLEMDALAKATLDQRGVRDQPQVKAA